MAQFWSPVLLIVASSFSWNADIISPTMLPPKISDTELIAVQNLETDAEIYA